MTLSVDIHLQQGGFALNAAFEAGPGVTAIFGRSGSGKTSLVNAIAGLSQPETGQITLNGRRLFDAGQGVKLPVHQRRLGYVFQDARLFPHMDVAANLRFGARFAASKPDKVEENRIIDMLGIRALLPRHPGALSGGERQRVALGRALLSNPDILLMDEPLAALDAARKEDILPYLERLRDSQKTPIIYVSHSVSEIARLADHIVLIQGGNVLRSGPTDMIMSDPKTVPVFGVREAGAVICAQISDHGSDGLTKLKFDGGELFLPGINDPVGDKLRIRIPAQDVILAQSPPTGLSAINIIPVTVTGLRQGDGPGVAVGLIAGKTRILARVTARSATQMQIAPGQQLYAILKATAVARSDIGQMSGA